MVNLDLYRVFYTVAKCGSLTKAAEELFISQPAVSQAVKQLESQLGTTLFTRTHRGMELTPQGGEQIFRSVERALFLLETAENRIAELKTSPTGVIRVGASETIFSYVLADKIIAFSRTYPGVKFDMRTGTSVDTIRQLKEGKVDIGFLNLPIDDPDVAISASVFGLTDVFVVGQAFAPLAKKEMELSELQGYPLLMLEENTIARRAFDAFLKGYGVELLPAFEVGSWDFMKKLAVQGMGIACLPREYAARELEEGSLLELCVSPALPARAVGMSLPKNVTVTYALKKFISLF